MMSGLDWTEELKKRTGIDFLTTRPMEIEKKSFEIIKGELARNLFPGIRLMHFRFSAV